MWSEYPDPEADPGSKVHRFSEKKNSASWVEEGKIQIEWYLKVSVLSAI